MKCSLNVFILMTVLLVLTIKIHAADTKKLPELKVRVTDFPPQYYKTTTGEWTGLDVELAKALLSKAGFTADFSERPWSRALQEMEQGSLHMMMNLSITEERAKYMTFIGPERLNNTVLVVKKSNLNMHIGNLSDLINEAKRLKGKFAIQQDAFYSEEFNDKLKDPQFAQYFNYVTEAKLNPQMTSVGRVLGFFEDENTVKYQLTHNPAYADLAIYNFTLSSQEVYFGFSKSGVSSEFINKLKQAFKLLEEDGTFREIRKRVWN